MVKKKEDLITDETDYLFNSPTNKARLEQSIDQCESLIDEDTLLDVVTGEKETIQNGERSYVIMMIVCKDEEEAVKVHDSMVNRYRNVQSRKITRKEVYPTRH